MISDRLDSSPEFLADCEAVAAGRMSHEQLIERYLNRIYAWLNAPDMLAIPRQEEGAGAAIRWPR